MQQLGRYTTKWLLIFAAIFAAMNVYSAAQPAAFTAGMKAYRSGDYKTAQRYLSKSAAKGHAESQYRLGKIYEKGFLGKPDNAKMVRWYRKAADNGHVKSQFKIGSGYAQGVGGLPQDPKKAEAYMLKSAKAGYSKAMKTLGKLYKKGKYGFPRDKNKARYWTKKYEKSK
ncbi:MAG: hypothetical protein BMS9Abin11_0869 [Gammaproteobacteria bacterium]|nr:MAG: hypothetical protein BMS9Abin11_0869 [Gammaproteobacteria bacterium]